MKYFHLSLFVIPRVDIPNQKIWVRNQSIFSHFIDFSTPCYSLFSRSDVQQLFREKDRDHDGYLSFEEFVGQETKIEMAFKAMDKDGDGSISKDEFRKVCKSLTNEQVTAAFNKFDKEGTGKLNYREFCSMMNNRKDKKNNNNKKSESEDQASSSRSAVKK